MRQRTIRMMEAVKLAMARSQAGMAPGFIKEARWEADKQAAMDGYKIKWGPAGVPVPNITNASGSNVTAELFDLFGQTMSQRISKKVPEGFEELKEDVASKVVEAMNTLLDTFPEHPKELLAVVALEHVANQMDIWSTDHKKKFKSVLK